MSVCDVYGDLVVRDVAPLPLVEPDLAPTISPETVYRAGYVRGAKFDEIILDELQDGLKELLEGLVDRVAKAKKVDEHGGWIFGVEGDGQDWVAHNWAAYGIGYDTHSGKLLAVIQVRSSSGHVTRRRRFINTRKSYFLMGTNEDETVFAHPVSYAPVRSAVNRDKDVIKAAQDWIFLGDYAKMQRQGDMGAYPCKTPPRKLLEQYESQMFIATILEGSHKLTADNIFQAQTFDGKPGAFYALNPYMVHLPGVHPDINIQGWARMIVGRRGHWHEFAVPTVD